MIYQIDKLGNKAKFWIDPKDIESTALDQIANITCHPRLYKWVAIMPDVHTGIGATIGSVIPMDGVLIPSAVGVDIGCGMRAVPTDINVNDVDTKILEQIHNKITDLIPLGFDHRNKKQLNNVSHILSFITDTVEQCQEYDRISKSPVAPQLGTLGGGNHFIEFQKDEDGKLWLMVHSGSRNIGNILAIKHIRIAKKIATAQNIHCPRDLEYLEEDSQEGQNYLKDMHFSMEFARSNRFVMMSIIKEIVYETFKNKFLDEIDIHHNYAAREEHFGKNIWIHRKGATKVKSDITGIIPGSMGTPSYIVKGTDEENSFNSCSHGSGRTMSRRKAKKVLSLDEFNRQMEGIFSYTVDNRHIDEAPNAYKNIDTVIACQKDLIDIVVKLKPILNIKG